MRVVIVGGGTAGWLTAAIIASKHHGVELSAPEITVIESANIPIIGVGEGTWPTMRNTLHSIGLREKDVFRQCSAAFKQGGKFVNWVSGDGDFYYHPFNLPTGYGRLDLAPYLDSMTHYAEYTNFQHHVCEAGLAPRTLADDEYQGPCNYGYHLDAGAFGQLLHKHCVEKLSVKHIVDDVMSVSVSEDERITGLMLKESGGFAADLYIDCTGMKSMLLGDALKVEFNDVSSILFNDRALAIQVPYSDENAPVSSHTIATAQNAGWIWDIGLTSRRGVGHVYSSDFLSDDEAEYNLRSYLGESGQANDVRKIEFESGYREQFWKNNCVAVGLSAGFVEPLEATAIMLVELSARYIADNLIDDQIAMRVLAHRFNEQMHYRWQRIIDFLKLHYMLTKRSEPYWQEHAKLKNVPQSLLDDLAVWKYRGPSIEDFKSAYELFPAASYQYVLYGMGFAPDFQVQRYLYTRESEAKVLLKRSEQMTSQLLKHLPPHRDYINRWLASA